MEWRRQNEANQLLTRGSTAALPSSPASATICSIQARPLPSPSAGHMVRSFSIQNGLPSFATRKCAMKGDRRDNAATARAETAITGEASPIKTKPADCSTSFGSEKPLAAPDSRTSGLSRGSRSIVDTAANRSIKAVSRGSKQSTICLHFFYAALFWHVFSVRGRHPSEKHDCLGGLCPWRALRLREPSNRRSWPPPPWISPVPKSFRIG